MINNIVFIGAGRIGQAIAHIIEQNESHPNLVLWDQNLELRSPGVNIEEEIHKADLIFCCVNSWILDAVLSEYAPKAKDDAIFVLIAKGLRQSDGATTIEIASHYLKEDRVLLLSGPMLADELISQQNGAATIACTSSETYSEVSQLFLNTNLKVEYSNDLIGTAYSAVLKNVYAILQGMVQAARLGMNQKGILVKSSLEEMGLIISIMGGQPETLFQYCGIADFIATGFSSESTNHSAGIMLWQSGRLLDHAEGLVSLQALIIRLKEKGANFDRLPLLSLINDCVSNPLSTQRLVRETIG